MRITKILTFICMILMSTGLVIQAAEVPQDQAVASVTLADQTQVFYYDSITEAIDKAEANANSTLQLLDSITLESGIKITTGDFTIDLNGKQLEYTRAAYTAVTVSGGTVCFLDSSSEQTGTIKGTASAVSVSGSAKVCVKSGIYQADSWTFLTTALSTTENNNPIVNIEGGSFAGHIAVHHNRGELTISGGAFYSKGQAALVVDNKADVCGGNYYGQIQVFSYGTLNFQDGNHFVHDYSATGTVYGIENDGTLNLSGGTIAVADNEESPVCGIINRGVLNLLGDVTFDDLSADFYLSNAMNICHNLQNCYQILWTNAYADETVTFATAGDGITLSKENFVSTKKDYLVVLSEDQSSLAIVKCEHPEVDEQFICVECGIAMQARIGNQYYELVEDAIQAAAENQTVVLLADIENLSIGSGTFSLDLNGYAIKDNLSINGGKITLEGEGTSSSGEYIGELNIIQGASVEIEGVAVKGTDVAILSYGGELVIKCGEISAERIAIINMGGSVTIGEDGAGPVIKAPIGIVNSKAIMEEINLDAVLSIYGGTVTAETDIYNQTGDGTHVDEFLSRVPLTAGTVNLKGGTFVDGLHVMLDEGLDLTDILDGSRGYYGKDGQVIPVGSGTVQLNQTVMVKIHAKVGDISTSENSKTTYGKSYTIGVTVAEDRDAYDYTYQWYDASGIIQGATSPEYTVPAGQAAGDYSYFCRVTATRKDNGLAETKDSAPIRVTIEKAPQSDMKLVGVPEKITAGDTFKLSIEGGESECDLVWSITHGAEIASIDPVTGNVTVNGTGTFTVKVISKGNGNYIETSQTVTLTAQLADKSEEPADKPEEPEDKPEEPTDKPEEPADKPDDSDPSEGLPSDDNPIGESENEDDQSDSPVTSDEGPDKWINLLIVSLFALFILQRLEKRNIR